MNISLIFPQFTTQIPLESLKNKQVRRTNALEEELIRFKAFVTENSEQTSGVNFSKHHSLLTSKSISGSEFQEKIKSIFISCQEAFKLTAALAQNQIEESDAQNSLSEKVVLVTSSDICDKALEILENTGNFLGSTWMNYSSTFEEGQLLLNSRMKISFFTSILKTQKIALLLIDSPLSEMGESLKSVLIDLKKAMQKNIQNNLTYLTKDEDYYLGLGSHYDANKETDKIELKYNNLKKQLEGENKIRSICEELHAPTLRPLEQFNHNDYENATRYLEKSIPKALFYFSAEQKSNLQINYIPILDSLSTFCTNLCSLGKINIKRTIVHLSTYSGIFGQSPNILGLYTYTKKLRNEIHFALNQLTLQNPNNDFIRKEKEKFLIFSAQLKVVKLHYLLICQYMRILSNLKSDEEEKPRLPEIESFIKNLIQPLEIQTESLRSQFDQPSLEKLLSDIKTAKQRSQHFLNP